MRFLPLLWFSLAFIAGIVLGNLRSNRRPRQLHQQ
jgi:hypothetical protein